MKNVLMMTLLAIAVNYGSATAQKPAIVVDDRDGWHKIGGTTVNFEKDRDEILVIGADRFASIKFKVKGAPIQLMDLEVYYESGDKQDINVNMPIKELGESRVIDLNGGERDLKKIVFVYKTISNRKDVKAEVEVWGYKTNIDKK